MIVIGIQRDERFSPNSVERDLAILRAVVGRLDGAIIRETELSDLHESFEHFEYSENTEGSENSEHSDPAGKTGLLILNMGRQPMTLAALKKAEKDGSVVVNPAEGVEACRRSSLVRVMRELAIPQPPAEGDHGYWLKRGDAAAQSKADVVFCKDKRELESQKQAFRERGIADMVVQAHVEGDLVKFYGVEGTGFFRAFYPSDDGQSKFGDEQRNGQAHRYAYQPADLQAAAEKLSRAVLTPVYGGDAIIRGDGSFVIIDFNDWPSFSRCRDEAADAISKLALAKMETL